MIIKNLLLIGVLLNSLFSTTKLIDYYIQKTNQQFNQIEDYQVDMLIELDVPAFRMPKKKYKVFYKNPNKIKVKAKGFGMLPKTGIFTSPSDNFDNLKNLYVSDYHDADKVHNILLVGDLIVDSLKLEMPNEYS